MGTLPTEIVYGRESGADDDAWSLLAGGQVQLTPGTEYEFCGFAPAPIVRATWEGGEYDIYVDALTGDDGHGGALVAPVATLARAVELAAVIGDGVRIALAAGTEYRETFSLPQSGVVLGVYGSGALPVIRKDLVIDGGWAGSVARGDAYSHVYSRSLEYQIGTVPSVDNGIPVLFEDGEQLVRVESVALCDAAPGSFYVTGKGSSGVADRWVGGTYTYYMHPRDSTDPGSDGKTYEYNTLGRINLGPSATISRVRFRRAGDKDNLMCGADATISRCLFDDNPIHDAVIASGTYDRCLGYHFCGTGLESHIGLTSYAPDGSGMRVEWVGCAYAAGSGWHGLKHTAAFGGHTLNTGAGVAYDELLVDGCVAHTCATVYSPVGATNALKIARTRIISARRESDVSAYVSSVVEDCWLEGVFPTNVFLNTSNPLTITGLRVCADFEIALSTSKALTLSQSTLVPSGTGVRSRGPWLEGLASDMTLDRVIFADAAGRKLAFATGASGTDATVASCVFQAEPLSFRAFSTALTTLSAVGAAGVDIAGSVIANPVIADAVAGDFSASGAGLPAGAGVQDHTIQYLAPSLTVADGLSRIG